MSKAKRLGLVTLIIGGVIGFVIRGIPGLVFAAVCLVVGLVMLVLSEARGTRTKVAEQRNERAPEASQVLVLLKEIHARPQRNGKFQEISAADQSGLEFEVFLNCWLLNETDLPVQIVDSIQLTIRASDVSCKFGERVSSDLGNWRLGSLVKDEWNPDKVRAAQEEMSELNTTEPLECGVPRQGWLHFRFRDIRPSDFRVGMIELIIKDAASSTHVGRASGPRQLPGKIWPYVPSSAPVREKSYAAVASTTGRPAISQQAEQEPYYWVVICKNHKFHEQQNIYSGHKIALGETDEFTPPPRIESFTAQCDECGIAQSYQSADLMRFQMPAIPDFRAHPLFVDV